MAVLFVLIGSSFISGIGAPEQVDTSEAITEIQANNVDTATIIDRDQVLELTLKDGSSAISAIVPQAASIARRSSMNSARL